MRKERRLRVFENSVLRRVFGPKRDEVTAEWRKLHNEELNDLYSLPNIVRVVKSRIMIWAGHCFSSKCRLFDSATLFGLLYYSHFTYRMC
jgi:hypothetical protein